MTEYAQGGPVGGGGGFWLDGCTPRYIAHPAPELTAAEAEIVARFESAPTPPEVVEARVVEEVARAIAEAQGVGRTATPLTRRLAAAAVAGYRAAQDGEAEEAVRERVMRSIEEGEQHIASGAPLVTLDAALAPQAGDERGVEPTNSAYRPNGSGR